MLLLERSTLEPIKGVVIYERAPATLQTGHTVSCHLGLNSSKAFSSKAISPAKRFSVRLSICEDLTVL